jgi:hypothetical protein
MARFTAAWVTAGAGSATLPIASLYSNAIRPKVVEIGIFNTTAVAVTLRVVRLTTTGTQGAAITAGAEDDPTQAAVATPRDTHTVAPTLGANLRVAPLGAAIGSGVIFPFGGGKTSGAIVPETAGAGIGIVPIGTGQICAVYITWDE